MTSPQHSKLGAEQYLVTSHNAQFHWHGVVRGSSIAATCSPVEIANLCNYP